jgi:hypothetical protein
MPQEDAVATGDTARLDQSLYDHLRQTVLTGVAITVPVIITLYVLTVALGFITSALEPLVTLLQWLGVIERVESVTLIALLIDAGVYSLVVDFLTELIAVAILLATVLLVGTGPSATTATASDSSPLSTSSSPPSRGSERSTRASAGWAT